MSLTIQLPAEAEARLTEQAKAIGVDMPTYADTPHQLQLFFQHWTASSLQLGWW
jgi:hypothetical protein